MVKLIVSLFLVFNLALLDACNEAPTTTKPTTTQAEEKTSPKPEPTKPAENITPTPESTEVAKNTTTTPSPSPTIDQNKSQKDIKNTPTPTPTPTPTNTKNTKVKPTATPTPTPTPTPIPANTKNIKPTPTPTPITKPNNTKIVPLPAPTPAPAPKVETDQGAAVYRAVDLVLGRKPASVEEKNNALKTVKGVLSVKEIKNARNKRNDQNLLKDRYPKGKELKVAKNQVVFWNGYDRIHFAARHLMDYFDTTDVKGKNSWWPAGTTQEQIDRYLQLIIETYGAKITLPNPASTGSDFKYFDFDLPDKNKMRVSVGIQSDGRITSFFPKTGQNVISISETDAQKLLTAVGK